MIYGGKNCAFLSILSRIYNKSNNVSCYCTHSHTHIYIFSIIRDTLFSRFVTMTFRENCILPIFGNCISGHCHGIWVTVLWLFRKLSLFHRISNFAFFGTMYVYPFNNMYLISKLRIASLSAIPSMKGLSSKRAHIRKRTLHRSVTSHARTKGDR